MSQPALLNTDGVDTDHAVQIAPRVWWVGSVLPGDEFQCHAYLVEAGANSALIDPGSVLTIEETLRKVREVVPVESLRWIVCHHSDPDVASSLPRIAQVVTRPDARVVTEWRAEALLVHYGSGLPFQRIEDLDWRLDLGAGRALEFLLTPYLHFPGALVSYETGTQTLFSADIFGGFVTDPSQLMASDPEAHQDAIRPFHQHYMPSRELLAAGLARIRRRWPQIEIIAPQHGYVVPAALVDGAFRGLAELECGVLSLAEADLDLAELLRVESGRRRLEEALLTTLQPEAVAPAVVAALAPLLPVRGVAIDVQTPEDGWVRFGTVRGVPGVELTDSRDLLLPLPGHPAAQAVLRRYDTEPPSSEVQAMLQGCAGALRVAVDRLLTARTEALARHALEQESWHDPLTALLNRRGLSQRLPAGPYCALLLDVDHFKAVNDTFGHDAGDEVLRRVCAAISAGVRPSDVVARVGGEEIVAILPGAEVGAAAEVAERMRARVALADLSGLAPGGKVTVSIGVSCQPDASPAGADGQPQLDAALARADAALYQAKETGRDRVVIGGA